MNRNEHLRREIMERSISPGKHSLNQRMLKLALEGERRMDSFRLESPGSGKIRRLIKECFDRAVDKVGCGLGTAQDARYVLSHKGHFGVTIDMKRIRGALYGEES